MDVYKWLGLCVSGLNLSIAEFWNMPFFMVVDLIKQVSPNTKEVKSRKEILEQKRYTSKKFGWV